MRLRYKALLVVLFLMFLINFLYDRQSKAVFNDRHPVIVVDAGHGGRDPGKVGVNNVNEKEINLQISLMLQSILNDNGYRIVMTREEDIGLYSENSDNRKREDLLNRVRIVDQVNPVMVISIHQNSFTDSSCKGAQVFYHKNSQDGKKIAEYIQSAFKEQVDSNNHREVKSNDTYYLLKNTSCPTVIVECGFLSNTEECNKLSTVEYQMKVAKAIFRGINQYINQ